LDLFRYSALNLGTQQSCFYLMTPSLVCAACFGLVPCARTGESSPLIRKLWNKGYPTLTVSIHTWLPHQPLYMCLFRVKYGEMDTALEAVPTVPHFPPTHRGHSTSHSVTRRTGVMLIL
jgi:hypothetical protein